MCDHRLWDQPDSPTCTRLDPHKPGHGCTYVSTDGSASNDKHDEGGHG